VEVNPVTDVSQPSIMGDMLRERGRAPRRLRASASASASESEYRDLFESTYPRLVRTLWFVVHDHELAQEIAQEAFVELYRQWSKVGGYDRPDLWVRRVALRRAQREAARAVRRLRAERDSVAELAVSDPGLPDPALRAAVLALPPQQRAVVALYYLEDRPMQEVANLLGCSTATGFVHLHRARHRLAELLAEEVDGDVR